MGRGGGVGRCNLSLTVNVVPSTTRLIIGAGIRTAMIAVVALVLSACSLSGTSTDVVDADTSVTPLEPVEAAPTEPGPSTIPFHLDVSNQSFDEPEVRLRIFLDDSPIIDDNFPVRDQHHVVRHDLHLEPGNHQVRIVEPGTGFTLDETFSLNSEAWANVSYWGTSGNGPRLDWLFSREELVYG